MLYFFIESEMKTIEIEFSAGYRRNKRSFYPDKKTDNVLREITLNLWLIEVRIVECEVALLRNVWNWRFRKIQEGSPVTHVENVF